MDTKQQIKVIGRTLKYLKDDYNNYDYPLGICHLLARAIEDETKIQPEIHQIIKCIPLFTRHNAIKYCNAPKEQFIGSGSYWWDVRNYKDGRLFLLRMRRQLREQLKNGQNK